MKIIKIIPFFILLLLPISIKAYDENASIIFLGDSYAVGYNQRNHSYYFTNPYPNIIGERLGVTIHNYSDISRGVIAKDHKNKKFIDGLEESYKDINDKNNIIWVLIIGGFNDSTFKSSDVVGEGISLVNKVKEYYPNANIAIGMCGRRKYSATFNSVLNAYKEIANSTNIFYVEGIEDVLKDNNEDLFFSDNFHPNSNGQQKLADYLINFLIDNSTESFVINDNTRIVEDKNETVNILDSVLLFDRSTITVIVSIGLVALISYALVKREEEK